TDPFPHGAGVGDMTDQAFSPRIFRGVGLAEVIGLEPRSDRLTLHQAPAGPFRTVMVGHPEGPSFPILVAADQGRETIGRTQGVVDHRPEDLLWRPSLYQDLAPGAADRMTD